MTDMEILAQLERDRMNLIAALEQMQAQHTQLGVRIQQQSGAIQYVELLVARVKNEQTGTEPGVSAAE